ncbi:Ubiquitin carboxyl-terminal hydrolase 47 [Aphanomyces cochlioides]|nr:Ubiquitin carboxyl-terminal hydrolase 47 [Aphanomyces cochlioides]
MDNKEGAKWSFVVDRREPLQTLKDQLVKFLDMPPNSFRLLRGASEYAQELKHLNVSFMKLSMIDHTILFVSPGRPLAGGVQPEELTLLMKFIVLNDVMVDKVRAAIAQHFAVKGIHAPYLRLQDYCHRRLKTILPDGVRLSQASQLTLVQDRRFAVQILAEPEELPRDHMLFYISVLDRANLKFGPLQEIIFEYEDRQESWIDILSNKVHEATGIPIESMLFAKPDQSKSVNILEVEDFSWIDREQGRHHLDPKLLSIYSDMIVVADGSVPLKKLSKEVQDDNLALVANLNNEEL